MLHFFFHYKVHSLTYSTFSVPASTVCSKRCKCYNNRRDWEVSATWIMLLMLCIIGNLLFLDRDMLMHFFENFYEKVIIVFFLKRFEFRGAKMVITYQCIAARCMHASHSIQWLLYAVPLVSLCFFKKRTNLMQRGLPRSSQLLKIIIRKMIKNIVTMIHTNFTVVSVSDWNWPILILQNIVFQEQPLGKLTLNLTFLAFY